MISKEKQFFLKKAFLLCMVVVGCSLLLYDSVLKGYYLKTFPIQLGIIVVITILSHLKMMNAHQQNDRRFSTIFLSTMSIKLFIYMAFILISLLIDKSNAVNFVVTFLVLYLIFTIFEVIEITKFLKKNPNSSN